jgi:lactoylglutathione lyase
VKLNHVNLTVDDVQAARAFLETYFGLRTLAERGRNFATLMDDDGFVLTLVGGGRSAVRYPKTFHIGFMQASDEDVDALNERLRADGFEVEPPSHQHGYTFYMEAPGGFTVEVLR